MAVELFSVLEEVVGGEAEVPWPEVTMTNSSSGGDTIDRSEDGSGDRDEESGVVDPRSAEL
jgi:hypothetical protein